MTETSTFTDPRDGTVYKTVKIGNQVWFAENLNYAGYDTEEVYNGANEFLGTASKCYENKPENGLKYGRLYNWAAAIKACPPGWHLPTKAEWGKLIKFAGGKKYARYSHREFGWLDAGGRLKTTAGWADWCEKSGCGTDDFDFAALPGGLWTAARESSLGPAFNSEAEFSYNGSAGAWWSATEYTAGKIAYFFSIGNSDTEIILQQRVEWLIALSVRCVKDG